MKHFEIVLMVMLLTSCDMIEVELTDCYKVRTHSSQMKGDTLFININDSYTCDQWIAGKSDMILGYEPTATCEECELKNNK